MAEVVADPPLPEDPSCLTDNPQKLMLHGFRLVVNGTKTIHLIWHPIRPHPNHIASNELYFYEQTDEPLHSYLWRKLQISCILPLPRNICVTYFLTSRFRPNRRYFFIIRAKDHSGRLGAFSDPLIINL